MTVIATYWLRIFCSRAVVLEYSLVDCEEEKAWHSWHVQLHVWGLAHAGLAESSLTVTCRTITCHVTILKLLRLLSNTHLSAAPTCVIDTDKPLVTGYLTGERWDSDVLNPAVNHLP